MGSGGWLLSDTGCVGEGRRGREIEGGLWGELVSGSTSLCLHGRRRVGAREKRGERDVKGETTAISSVYSFMPPSALWGIHEDVWLQIRLCAVKVNYFWTAAYVSLCLVCGYACRDFYALRVFCMHPCACGRLLFQSACTCTTCGTQSQTVTYWNACGLLSVASLHWEASST